MRLLRSLYVQVLLAILAGVLIGHFAPEQAVALKPLGDAFVKLIKMAIAPVIFCTVTLGIAGMEDLKSVGRTGLYALGYFEAVTTLALVVGLVIINWVAPGAGMHVDPASLDPSRISQYVDKAGHQGIVGFLMDIIPVTLFDAFARGDVLQILFVALLTGFALHLAAAKARVLREAIEALSHVVFGIVGFIMKLAPLGALGAMAFTIGSQGIAALKPLLGLMLCFYATCLVFVFGVLGVVARLHGFRILPLLKYIKDELLIVLGTSSSESVLPRIMAKLQDLGCRRSVVGLVVPAGYSFNLDGTCIYLTMAAVFLAQATDTSMTLGQQLLMLAVLLLTSKGAAGVTGSGFIVLAGTLAAVQGPPVAALALILGIDRFMSEARALTNLVGNTVATLVVARWTGSLEPVPGNAVFTASGPVPPQATSRHTPG
jgi:aerobic C4-dicarboxylate transport protein